MRSNAERQAANWTKLCRRGKRFWDAREQFLGSLPEHVWDWIVQGEESACEQWGVTRDDLCSKRKSRDIAAARQWLSLRLRETVAQSGRPVQFSLRCETTDGVPALSYPTIAVLYGGNHTSYMLAVRREKRRIALTPATPPP